MKTALLGLGMALVLAFGGVGIAELASGAGHSDPGHNHAPITGQKHARQMREVATDHRDAMHAWQNCQRSHAARCAKPTPPGWVKHPDKHPGGWPPKHRKGEKGEKDGDHEVREDRD